MFLALITDLLLVQSTWIVDDVPGPDVDFTDLPAAVAAAADGDVLLVRPGHYAHFALAGKGLAIVGRPGVEVDAPGALGRSTTIADVPRSAHVLLEHLSFGGDVECAQGRLTITGTTTRATLIDVSATGHLNGCSAPYESAALHVDDGARTVVVRGSFHGGPGFRYGPHWGGSGGPAVLTTDDARLHVVGASLAGGPGVAGDTSAGGGGAGVSAASGSRVWLSDVESIGGPGSAAASGSTGSGGAGVAAREGAHARISGDGAGRIMGGPGFLFGGIGVAATGDAIVVVHAVEVWTGTAYFGLPGAPQSGGFVAAAALPVLRVEGRSTPDDALELTLSGGAAAAPFLLWVEQRSGVPLPLTVAPVIGEFAFRPELARPLFAGALSPAGEFHATLPPGALGAALYCPLRLQALVVAPGGALRLSNPVAFSLHAPFAGRYDR